MILVDSSVWIDYFPGVPTPQTDGLVAVLGVEPLAVGDLVITEAPQGFTSGRDSNETLRPFTLLSVIDIAGRDVALQAARNFRSLRARGVTVRKTIDAQIATRCIEDGHSLLYSDRDFDPFVEHLGLQSALE